MSSFKRRTTPSKQLSLPAGTRTSPGTTSTIITSTGIPSLDDVFGGGLPLSCSMLVLAPDAHSAYGELVQKYFISQGIANEQTILVIDDDANHILAECMWIPAGGGPTTRSTDEKDEDEEHDHSTKIKIAWRYEQMKQFQTTVSTPAAPSLNQITDSYCAIFDLTTRIPDGLIQSAFSSGKIVSIGVSSPDFAPLKRIIDELARKLGTDSAAATELRPLRVCIPSLGSSQWGDVSPQEICWFLHSLRTLLSRYPHACAAVCLPPHLCTDGWGGPGWVQKLSWLSDASIELSAFTANPSLTALFSSHHGLVHIHSLPSPHTLLPPSDKFSTLRGLSSSGENNLAFKCMRKRFLIETLHLDLEGGVGERRTTPATNAMALETASLPSHSHRSHISANVNAAGGGAAVEVQLEDVQHSTAVSLVGSTEIEHVVASVKKAKKKVAFTSDRPDLYDF
ncbi:Elongator complex protein 4 [Sparassis latifolia]|uniref:Elongator complex protein 4 n=1 Tax=Sparassis crispa TaxID=139825 RepID=A0A401G6U4_9APHY|nr:PAXNEB-domain-containing protein [Sparassis crispa]GBE77878.1 PAXNEB-domain-containing protein [Sparassis crispa]